MARSKQTADAQPKRRDGHGSIESRGGRHYWRAPKHLYAERPRVPLGAGLSDEEARGKVDALVQRGVETGQLKAMIDRLLRRSPGRGAHRPTQAQAYTTVRELLEAWTSGALFDQHGAVYKLRDQMSSAYIIKRTLEKHALTLKPRGEGGPELGELPVSDVEEDDIAYVMKEHTGSAATRQHTHKNLQRLFNLGIYLCKLRPEGTNPVKPHLRPPKDPEKFYNFLYPPEVLALLGCTSIPIGRRILYMVAVYWGARKGSLYALVWRCLDFVNEAVSLLSVKGVQRLGAGGDGARGTPLLFVSDPSVMAVLAAWRVYCGMPRPDEPVIRGLELERNHDERKVLLDDLKLAGVTREILFSEASNVEKIRFHDGRAAFCTWARRAGKTDAWIRERSGHSPSGKMIDRYTRQAQTLADLGYEPFPDVRTAIPELAELAALSTRLSTRGGAGASSSAGHGPFPVEYWAGAKEGTRTPTVLPASTSS